MIAPMRKTRFSTSEDSASCAHFSNILMLIYQNAYGRHALETKSWRKTDTVNLAHLVRDLMTPKDHASRIFVITQLKSVMILVIAKTVECSLSQMLRTSFVNPILVSRTKSWRVTVPVKIAWTTIILMMKPRIVSNAISMVEIETFGWQVDSALHALTRLTQVLKSMSASLTSVMKPDSSLKMMEHAILARITSSQLEWNAPSQPV